MSARVINGDMLEVVPTLLDIDACICDPPYHLVSIVKRFGGDSAAPAKFGTDGAYARASAGFMNQVWDGGDIAFRPEAWRIVLDAMKPGAWLAAFGGSRTWHRMAVAIEDAGFEIKDTALFLYGVGFPKSFNLDKHLDDEQRCLCENGGKSYKTKEERRPENSDVRGVSDSMGAEDALPGGAQQDVLAKVRSISHISEKDRTDNSSCVDTVRNVRLFSASSAERIEAARKGILQQQLPEQDICGSLPGDISPRYSGDDTGCSGASHGASQGANESFVEGRGDVSESARQLRVSPVCEMPAASIEHGQEGRLHNGASSSDGGVGRTTTDADGVRSSCGPQAAKQSSRKPRTLAGQSQPQADGAWHLCGGCGKPRIPRGLGTALKPAFEPIILARKPLSEKTVVANVLAHGTGAINIDACRVGTEARFNPSASSNEIYGQFKGSENEGRTTTGRWPANVLHDGSEEVEAAFAAFGEKTSGWRNGDVHKGACGVVNNFGASGITGSRFSDSGTASRFFYSAKASKADRAGSKHPTVKPIALMRWLCRLVTPPGGTILDPFAGSGSTLQAAVEEGFNAVGIEREAEYYADICRRIGVLSDGVTPKPKAAPAFNATGQLDLEEWLACQLT